MTEDNTTWPELHSPDEEAAVIKAMYDEAKVILEYGSGGSTVLAASMPGKLVFSVESDAAWALRLQIRIDEANLPSPATVHHVDIGPTGAWGRPTGPDDWEKFWRYPVSVWDAPFFRHPDVVLIDGRFRTACFMTTLFQIKRPVTILFDDYVHRPDYHGIEEFCRPSQTVGRMAVFEAHPDMLKREHLSTFMDLFNRATYAQESPSNYKKTISESGNAQTKKEAT